VDASDGVAACAGLGADVEHDAAGMGFELELRRRVHCERHGSWVPRGGKCEW
jgi:hypothetical protein